MSGKSDVGLVAEALLAAASAIENGKLGDHDVAPVLREAARRMGWAAWRRDRASREVSAACASCLICASIVSDVARGWIRNPLNQSDPRVWFLCGSCVDRQPFLDWSSAGPSLQFFAPAAA